MELRMSAKERDRVRVLEQVRSGQLKRGEACEQLRVSERQFRRIAGRYEKAGDAGLVHRSRGRVSNRRFPAEVRARAVEELEGPYKGFGPTLAAEKLEELNGIVVSRETVRKWQAEEKLREPRRRGVTHREWRERRACFGEMVQIDTSKHDWLEGRGESCVLIGMIDDATSRAALRFFESDTTKTNMAMLGRWMRRHGRPLAVYGDKASHFVVNRGSTVEEDLTGVESESQIGRALRELEVEYIRAHSPQAKGRVERLFGTCQDRLVKELRLGGIGTIAEANKYLDRHFVPMWNRRFTVAPLSEADAHRGLEGHDLGAILSNQECRVVRNDYTIQFGKARYQILRGSAAAGLRGSKVIVEERLDGRLWLRWRGRYLDHVRVGARGAPPPATPRVGSSSLRSSSPPRGVPPSPNHPWKRAYKRTLLPCAKPDTSTLR